MLPIFSSLVTSDTSWKYSMTRFLMLMCLLSGLLTTSSGCNYFVPLAYLIGGPPSIEPDFDVMTKKSLSEKEITVAVVAYAPPELKWDFPKIDHELARYVSYRLVQNHIKVINPDQIQQWLDQNSDWNKPEELGRTFGCDYVIYIDMGQFSLYEENSTTLYRGRSESYISVFEMDKDKESENCEKIYSREVVSKFPIRAPRSTSEMALTTFKKEYLTRLSEEIGWLFYEHYNGDDMQYAL